MIGMEKIDKNKKKNQNFIIIKYSKLAKNLKKWKTIGGGNKGLLYISSHSL